MLKKIKWWRNFFQERQIIIYQCRRFCLVVLATPIYCALGALLESKIIFVFCLLAFNSFSLVVFRRTILPFIFFIFVLVVMGVSSSLERERVRY